jgi:hypothetical protein
MTASVTKRNNNWLRDQLRDRNEFSVPSLKDGRAK